MFKDSFKYYKAKWPIPDFSEVVDFDGKLPESVSEIAIHNVHKDIKKESIQSGVEEVTNVEDSKNRCIQLGLVEIEKWKCYEFKERPGLLFVKNPFTAEGQRYWMARCVRDYPKTPNVVNLNPNHFHKDIIYDWWTALQGCTDHKERQRTKVSMRWTTLGYHHDWDTKVYSEKMKHQFPADLAELSRYFATVLNLGNYSAEAAIVNYYPIGTTLAGHTDHSESDLEAPLFSFSFGQSAIFLLGGTTKEEKPTAMFLKSGDVVVMSRASRVCYHAVPRVMKADHEPWLSLGSNDSIESQPLPKKKSKPSDDTIPYNDGTKSKTNELCDELFCNVSDENFWSPFKDYLRDSRININVRQVLKEGQKSLCG